MKRYVGMRRKGRIQDSGFRISGFQDFRISGFQVSGFQDFRISGFRIQDSGFRIQDSSVLKYLRSTGLFASQSTISPDRQGQG